jgi:type I restriction enzyme S subunit
MRTCTTTSVDLFAKGFRLDASYHANEGSKAFNLLHRWKSTNFQSRRLESIGDVCLPNGIYIGGRAKRIYVDDPEHGIPFLSSSDMLLPSLGTIKLISNKQPELKSLLLHPGWTLISRSGTIGNTAYVRSDMDGVAGSEHIMRVVANPNKILPGYLYAFLSSDIGVRMIRQGTFGAVIDTIEPKYIASLPIPRLDPAQEEHIHQLIEQAAELRVKANQYKFIAEKKLAQLLHVELGILGSKSVITYIHNGNLNDRFEASYHCARHSASTFDESPFPLVPIGDLLDRIFYLGKLHRVFVEDSTSGIPLLAISDVQKAKLTSNKYISKSMSRNVSDAILKRGWILVSRSGTPGIVTYVRREMVGWVGSDDLIRLVPKQNLILPGFLYSLLSSAVGLRILLGSAHGSVQLKLPPDYIGVIKIPLPPIELQQEIHDLIEQYDESLTLASEMEDQAHDLLSSTLGISIKVPHNSKV